MRELQRLINNYPIHKLSEISTYVGILFFFLSLHFFFVFFFFFSSRRRHTRLTCDWSSDVCSSDLASSADSIRRAGQVVQRATGPFRASASSRSFCPALSGIAKSARFRPTRSTRRSEERRVGKECRSRGSPDH